MNTTDTMTAERLNEFAAQIERAKARNGGHADHSIGRIHGMTIGEAEALVALAARTASVVTEEMVERAAPLVAEIIADIIGDDEPDMSVGTAERRYTRMILERAISARPTEAPEGDAAKLLPIVDGARIRHKKRGTKYEVVGLARVQTDRPLRDDEFVSIYRGADGMTWARPPHEFTENRFELLPPAPPPVGDKPHGPTLRAVANLARTVALLLDDEPDRVGQRRRNALADLLETAIHRSLDQ